MMPKSFFLLFYLLLICSLAFIFGKPFPKFKERKTYYTKLDEPIPRELENIYDTYIILYFKEDCNYTRGFKNAFRNNIDYIINWKNNIKIKSNEALFISKNFGIEIHFNKSVSNLNYFFSSIYDSQMRKLKSIDFSNFDSNYINGMSYAFYGCSSLSSINFSNFKFSSVKSMASMFTGCSSLISIDLSNVVASGLTDTSSMFSGCSKLETINLTNFYTGKVTKMSSMFIGCSKLVSINLNSFDTSKVI